LRGGKSRKEGIIRDTSEIQRISRGYFEKLYSNKLENLEEINKFLDIYDLPKLSQEDINNIHNLLAERAPY
jgi:CRISPR/Cas system CMR-associated protein Cmr3 (group 5 of RAMP superfamily)